MVTITVRMGQGMACMLVMTVMSVTSAAHDISMGALSMIQLAVSINYMWLRQLSRRRLMTNDEHADANAIDKFMIRCSTIFFYGVLAFYVDA